MEREHQTTRVVEKVPVIHEEVTEVEGEAPMDGYAFFKDLDSDEDGYIGAVELRRVLVHKAQAGRFLRQADVDGDGLLDFDELFDHLEKLEEHFTFGEVFVL